MRIPSTVLSCLLAFAFILTPLPTSAAQLFEPLFLHRMPPFEEDIDPRDYVALEWAAKRAAGSRHMRKGVSHER